MKISCGAKALVRDASESTIGNLLSNTFSKPVLEKEICTTWDLYRAGISIAVAVRSLDPIRSVDLLDCDP